MTHSQYPEGVKQQTSPAPHVWGDWHPSPWPLGLTTDITKDCFKLTVGPPPQEPLWNPVNASVPGPQSVSTRAQCWLWALGTPLGQDGYFKLSGPELASPCLLVDEGWQPQCCLTLPRSPGYGRRWVGENGRLPFWSWSSPGSSLCWVGKDKRVHQSRTGKDSPRGWLSQIDVRPQNSHLSGIVIKT